MKKSFLKIISLFLIVGLNYSGIFAMRGTVAHFNDVEKSPNNLFGATKLDFSLDFLMSDGFRTQTQGGWGSVAKGDNPGVYRDANFDSAFPDGLTIGNIDYYNAQSMSTIGVAGDYYAHFTSSEAVEEFLPAKGTPAVFLQFYDNDPLDTEAGILAGQVVALTLNVGFDNYDPDFSVNEGKLADFYANEAGSLCEEMTAGEVLTEANLILSGEQSEFSPSEINECVTEINEKFVDGERTKITTSESVWRSIIIEKYDGLNFQHIIEIEQVSENSDLCLALKVDAYLNGSLVYSGNLLGLFNGPIVFSESANSWKLYISLDENAPDTLSNKSCEFKYIISGWQEDIEEGGFSDVEEIFDSVESGEWVSVSEKSLGTCDSFALLDLEDEVGDDKEAKPETEDDEGDDAKDEDNEDAKPETEDDEGDDADDDTEKKNEDDENGSSEEDVDNTKKKDNDTDTDADDTKEEDSDDTENGDDEEAKPEVSDEDEDDSDDDTENDDDVDTEGSTALQDNGASDSDDDTENGDDEEAKPEVSDEDTDDTRKDCDADDMKEEDNDTDTDTGDIEEEDEEAKPEAREDEAGDTEEDDDADADDNDEGANLQDDGDSDGLNKNMVDSVQASV